jgi:RNA polymerase sigma factor (sigma-70 family)
VPTVGVTVWEPESTSGELVPVGDAAVVRASLEQPEQFEAVFEQHHQAIWRYLARLGGRERADELAGEVFLVAFTRRGSYDPQLGSVRSWLYGIASNLLHTRLRSDGRRRRAFERAASQQVAAVSPEGIDVALLSRERLEAVLRALARLSTADREIILLVAWEHLSYEEVAAVMNLELGTVRSRLARARGRLKELTSGSGEFSDDVG